MGNILWDDHRQNILKYRLVAQWNNYTTHNINKNTGAKNNALFKKNVLSPSSGAAEPESVIFRKKDRHRLTLQMQ